MNKQLYDTVHNYIQEALDECNEGLFAYDYIPEKVTEMLEHRLDCPGQRVYTDVFWSENNDLDVVEETKKFRKEHEVTDYSINYTNKFAFVVYLVNEE